VIDIRTFLLPALLPALLVASLAAGEEDAAAKSEACLDCHDDINETLQHTVHMPAFGVSCQGCHGEGVDHIDDPLPENIVNPRGKTALETCLSCHEGDVHSTALGKDVHASSQVYCDDCHQAHSEARPPYPLLKAEQSDLCLSCHSDVRTAMSKPFTHQLGHAGMECASCHNPHAGRGKRSLKTTLGAEGPCLECHAELKGPFVFEHVTGVTGDCLSCHEPHGSSNPRLLKRAQVRQLCLECHSALPSDFLGSQPPATHNLRSPRYRNCTTCHTAVHGSSRSPALLK